jgi:phage I-like protein
MNTPREWKSETVLKVKGSIVREGVFHGRPGEDTSNPNALKPSEFTPELIEKAFNNIDGQIPIFLTHDKKGQPRHQIGSTFHAGITPTKDDIEVRGMIWEGPAINRIKNEGLNRFSPEFDFDYDTQGKIMNARIVGLIPTNSPAITNSPIEAISTVFDSIGGNMTGEQGATTVAPLPTGQGTTTTGITPIVASPPAPNNENAEIVRQLNALSAQMSANQEVIKSLQTQNEQLKAEGVNKLLVDVKALGVANPEGMIAGLPSDSQAAVLKAIKDGLSSKTPTATGGSSKANAGSPSKQDVENSILKEIGISRKEYDKLMTMPCPSLDKEE